MAARWCQRIAIFLVPFFLIIIAGHRWQFIDTPSVLWLLGLGIMLLLVSLGLGFIGLYQLWNYGHIGGMRTVRGIVLVMIMAAPYVQYGWLTFKLPLLHDITTDRFAPPAFEENIKNRAAGMNDISSISDDELELQVIAYPKIGPRRYATSADRVYTEVTKLMETRGWVIVAEDIPNVIDRVDIEGSVRKRNKQIEIVVPTTRPSKIPNPAPDQNRPVFLDAEEDVMDISYIEAVARSFVFGFESDVIVRIVEEDQLTLVDMRSSSRWGPHDFGSNAARISAFISDLDKSLAGIAGEG